MGDSYESSPAQAAQATKRPRLLHERRQTHCKIRLGLSRHGSDNPSVQQCESRHPELLPIRGQLGPTSTNPVHPPILAGYDLGAKIQNLDPPSVFKRFGKTLAYVIRDKEGKEKKTVSFYLNHDWAKNRDAFQNKKYADIDLIQSEMHMRSRSSIAKPCCNCGETLDKVQIEMHHVRHIRKLSDKRQATGFNRVLRMLNRKQIPVCKGCHGKIHQGKYDSIKLSDMAYLPH